MFLKYLTFFLILTISIQGHASCREELEQEELNLKAEFKESVKENAYVGLSVGALLFIISPPASAGLVGVMGSGVLMQAKEIRSLKKVIAVIDESYDYKDTNEAGKNLQKLVLKLNKKLKRVKAKELETEEVANTIMKLNENGQLCSIKRKNIKQLTKLFLSMVN